MTQKDSKVSKVSNVTSRTDSGKQLQIVFGRLHNLWTQNNKLWTKIAELERSNVELRSLVKGAA